MALERSNTLRHLKDTFRGREKKGYDLSSLLVQLPASRTSITPEETDVKKRKRNRFWSFFEYYFPRSKFPASIEQVTAPSTLTLEASSPPKLFSGATSCTERTVLCDQSSHSSESLQRQSTLDPYFTRNLLNSYNDKEQYKNSHPKLHSPLLFSGESQFVPRYDHSFSIEEPPSHLPKDYHAKWERIQMQRHAVFVNDLASLKIKRSQSCVFNESESSSFLGPSSSSSSQKDVRVMNRNMELIANVSGFFKSVGSLFTGGSPSKSLTDVSINVSAERVQTDGSETENSEKDLSLYSPSRLVHHLPVKAPHSIGLNLTQLFETFKEDSFQF